MAGLFAVGEAACWDMHGFNRLGGNSLAETLVAGRMVGRRVAEHAAGVTLRADTGYAFDAVDAAEQRAQVAGAHRQWAGRLRHSRRHGRNHDAQSRHFPHWRGTQRGGD